MIRLKISSLSPTTTKDRLMETFEEYGKVDSVKIFRSGVDNVPVFAFVFMTRESAALEAIDELNGKELGGSIIKIEMSFEHITVHRDPLKPKPVVVEDDNDDDDDEEEENESSQVDSNYEDSEEPNWEV